MIFNFILAVVAFLINGITAILPTLNIYPAGLASSISTFMQYVYGWDWLLDVGTLMTVLGILIILVLVEFTYFVTMYVISIIHASIRG